MVEVLKLGVNKGGEQMLLLSWQGRIGMNKVLIIDDEKRMLDLIALYLRPHKYVCQKAQGANEALSYIEDETFDIVLLDIMMPEMDGWELCQEIRRDRKSTRLNSSHVAISYAVFCLKKKTRRCGS